MNTLTNVTTPGGETIPPSDRVAPSTFPEAIAAKKGVSTRFVPDKNNRWFVFRASYGREDQAADFIIADGIDNMEIPEPEDS